MPRKKIVKKTQKTKVKKLGIDPTLKPRVVKTKSTWTEEQQNENPLNRMKAMHVKGEDYGDLKLPDGFKTADNITEVDDLKFENGRLREMLVSWLDRVMVDGAYYQVMCDPLNRQVQINREL